MSVARVEPLLRMPWTQRCGVGCEMSCICDQIKVFSGGVVPFCWTSLFLPSDYATRPSLRRRSMMPVPYSVLIRLSRYQTM